MRTRATQRRIDLEPWPPIEFCLPNLDELERISRGKGRKVQARLFPEGRDNSKTGRIERLCGIEGVTTADPCRVAGCGEKFAAAIGSAGRLIG